MSDVDAVTRREIDERLRSRSDEAVMSVYRSFGLATFGIGESHFYQYARNIRRRAAADRATEAGTDDTAGEVPSMEALRDKLLIAMYQSCQGGGAKAYELASMYARVQQYDRLAIVQEAQQRAAEAHAAKMKKIEPAVKEAIAAAGTEGSKDLRSILDRVSNHATTVDEAVREIGDVLWIEIDKQMRGAA